MLDATSLSPAGGPVSTIERRLSLELLSIKVPLSSRAFFYGYERDAHGVDKCTRIAASYRGDPFDV